METYSYTTTHGKTIDLTTLGPEERAFFDYCYQVYQRGARWDEFSSLIQSMANPLIQATGGWITRAFRDHPLWTVLRDLEDRAGIRQGDLGPDPGADLNDPLADEWLPVSEARRLKGVATNTIHEAITRGELVARPAREGGAWKVVSRRSLAHWMPNAVRQAAAGRRERHTAATGE